MTWIFTGFGLLTLVAYLAYCRGERSYLNAITALTVLKCIVEFGLEPISYSVGIFDYQPATFFKIYLASFIGYGSLVLGALRKRPPTVAQNTTVLVPQALPWLFLAAAMLAYLPIFVEFHDHILDPRYIYEQTRTGYGIEYYGSALLMNCALILFLLSRRRQHLLFLFVLLAFTVSKGSKGQVLTDLMIYAAWAVYVLNKRFSLRQTLVGGVVAVAAMGALFVLNYRGEIDSLVLTVAGYSDYNRNASLVVEDDHAPIYDGMLSFENVVYSKIPRALWPGKPKDFGEFLLAEKYFPELFELDQGAPSFGIGVYFADFGALAYLAIAAVNFFSGRMLRYFIRSCERRPRVLSFTMLLFFSDVSLLPVGVGYFLIETLVLALLLQQLVLVFGKQRIPGPRKVAHAGEH